MADKSYSEMTEAERAEIDRQESARESYKDYLSRFDDQCSAHWDDEAVEAACAAHDELEDGMLEREDATCLKGCWS